MLLTITLVLYTLLFIYDYFSIKKNQSKKQNIFYLVLFLISFILMIAYIFDIKLPITSDIIRFIVNK